MRYFSSTNKTTGNDILAFIETRIKESEGEIERIRQELTQNPSPEESSGLKKKLKEAEERLWALKVKIKQRTKKWFGSEESPCWNRSSCFEVGWSQDGQLMEGQNTHHKIYNFTLKKRNVTFS